MSSAPGHHCQTAPPLLRLSLSSAGAEAICNPQELPHPWCASHTNTMLITLYITPAKDSKRPLKLHMRWEQLLTFKGIPGWSSQLLIELLHPAGCALSLYRIIRRWPFHCFQLLWCQLLLLLFLHQGHDQCVKSNAI